MVKVYKGNSKRCRFYRRMRSVITGTLYGSERSEDLLVGSRVSGYLKGESMHRKTWWRNEEVDKMVSEESLK